MSDPLHNYALSDLSVGMTASRTSLITAEMVANFALITGDTNPLHTSEFGAYSPFAQPIAHGMLTGGLISAVLGTQLPGPGCLYVDQQIRFKAPVYINDEVTVEVNITAINHQRGLVTLATLCKVKDKLVTKGQAIMLVKQD